MTRRRNLDDALDVAKKFWMSECRPFEANPKISPYPYRTFSLLLLALPSGIGLSQLGRHRSGRRQRLFTNRQLREGSQLIRQD